MTMWLDVFCSPGGDSWADQKAGIEALATEPLSASRTWMGAEPISRLLWCKFIYSLSLKEINVKNPFAH